MADIPLFTDLHLQAFDSVLQNLGVVGYLCGGTVRDLLLNRPFRDVDVVLDDRVFEAADLFHKKLNAPFFVLDKERQVARVVCTDGNWDFTGFRNHTIEGDLKKRDFTINAMAVRWEDFYPGRSLDRVIDPFQGLAGLQNRLLIPVAESSMNEDPLRMLRAFRISAELGFAIDPLVHRDIERLHGQIAEVATERIVEELDRIFLLPDSAKTWRMFGQSVLFDSLFPELKAMKHCEQGGYHHLDVWEHTVLALENFEQFLAQIPRLFEEQSEAVQQYLETIPGSLDRTRLLKWATIVHDIGKPQTRELKEPGRWRFHGHDQVGADLAQHLFNRLKFARKDAQLISVIIQHHLRPLNLFNLEQRSNDDFRKFFRAVGPEAIGILLISYGDMTAARGSLADPQREPLFVQLLQQMITYYYKEYYPVVNTPELVKGRDLMVVLQMKPGPLMGEVLREIREAQMEGVLHDRDEAFDFARNWLKDRA